MKAPVRQRFWLAVMRFAYRRAKATDGWRMPVGIPGNRDPENPCEAFAPRPREPFEWGNCQTDGHYLCNECCHRAVPESGPVAL